MMTAGERLHLLYEINRRLATCVGLDELVDYVTRRARELFGAEGCALLLLDRERNEFFFPVSSQDAARRDTGPQLRQLRFPADRGVAGWVLAHEQAVSIADAASDPRFFDGVDQATHMHTRALLAAPLRTPSGTVGVIEVVNPGPDALSADNLEFLEGLADDIGVAYEKAELYERLRGEVLGLRQVCRVAGYALVLGGALVVAGAVVGHVAVAVSLNELPARAGFWSGIAAMGSGVVLLGLARGWFVRRAPVEASGESD